MASENVASAESMLVTEASNLDTLVEDLRCRVPREEGTDPVRASYRTMNFVSLVEDDEDYRAPAAYEYRTGDVIMEEIPFAAVVNNGSAPMYCHHCWKREMAESKLKRCTRCQFARYCNEECAKKSWKVHKMECSLLASYTKETGFVPDALIRLVNLVLMRVRNGITTVSTDSCLPPTERTLDSLCSHTAEIDKELQMTSKFQRNMREIKHFIGAEILSQTPPEVIAETYSRVMTNTISIPDRLGYPVGIGLYLGISQFDHSCLPNAVYFCQKGLPKLSLIATAPLRSLKEVRISYVDPMRPTTERRRELKESFYFVCQCGRCQGVEQDGMSRSLRCTKEGCTGYVLLGKDWRPMGPCRICDVRDSMTDLHVKKCQKLMMDIQRFAEDHGDDFRPHNAHSSRSSDQRHLDDLCSLLTRAEELLFPLNYYRLILAEISPLRTASEEHMPEDVDKTLDVLDSLSEALEFYLGPISIGLCEKLMESARICLVLKRWEKCVGYALRAFDIVKVLYAKDDQYYHELLYMLLVCKENVAD